MVKVLRKLDVPTVEQVIAVPLILPFVVEGRTVGGSADGARIFSGGHCRAGPGGGGQQRHWRSRSWTIRVGGEVAEVFKVYEQDRFQQRRTWSRSLTFQFLRVGDGEVEILKVLSQN